MLTAGAGGIVRRNASYGNGAWSTIAITGAGAVAWRGIGVNGANVMLVGDGGAVAVSTDSGASFALVTSGTTANLYCVGYAGSVWVIGGDGGNVGTTTDMAAFTWVSRGGANILFRGFAYGGTTATLVGYNVVNLNGSIYTSTAPATAWTQRTPNTFLPLYSVAFGNGVFLAVAKPTGAWGPEMVVSADNTGAAWAATPVDPTFDLLWVAYSGREASQWMAGGLSNHVVSTYGVGQPWKSTPVATIDVAALRRKAVNYDEFLWEDAA